MMIVQQVLTALPLGETSSPDGNVFGYLSVNVVFTTMITLAIFILGYILTALIDRRKKHRERNNLRLMVIEWLKQLSYELECYAASLKRISEQIAEPKQGGVFLSPFLSILSAEKELVDKLRAYYGACRIRF